VPNPEVRPEFLAHPRLRRTSPITHYAVATALEATAKMRANQNAERRLGLVVCLQSGCVNYSCRFYDETLKDPATASPLLFPETVYAAPASHVAAVLENISLASTLVGDPAAFLQGVSLAAQWLEEDRVEACLVIGAEEANWILADALWHLERSAVLTAGAGALCLCRESRWSAGVELAGITDAHTYSTQNSPAQAARAMRNQLRQSAAHDSGRAELLLGQAARQRRPTTVHSLDARPFLKGEAPAELLCAGIGSGARADAAEVAAWRDWTGTRVSPKQVLGEGLMAAAAWQCVAACDAVAGGRFAAANVSLVGPNQQAIGARFAAMAQTSRL
jgi:3-oxoacyl-(acyl-carrier-protein) synthase